MREDRDEAVTSGVSGSRAAISALPQLRAMFRRSWVNSSNTTLLTSAIAAESNDRIRELSQLSPHRSCSLRDYFCMSSGSLWPARRSIFSSTLSSSSSVLRMLCVNFRKSR